MDAQKKKKVLAIGYGLMGRAMSHHIMRSGWAEITGVVEPNAKARERAMAEFTIAREWSLKDLRGLNGDHPFQIASINTPSEHHFEQAMRCIELGMHVLVAKPITHNFQQAKRLIAHARANRRKLVVGQQMRFTRHYKAVSAFIASGALGHVEQIALLNAKPRHEALNLARMDQPAMLEMACHHFDALLSLLPKSRPRSIYAHGSRPSWSVYSGDCTVNAVIELTGGVTILYHGGFSSQADMYELRLEGTRGALRVRGEHMSAPNFVYEFAERGGAFNEIDVESETAKQSPWTDFMELWDLYLRKGKEPIFSGRKNLPTFALLSAGVESIQTGRKIRLDQLKKYDLSHL